MTPFAPFLFPFSFSYSFTLLVSLFLYQLNSDLSCYAMPTNPTSRMFPKSLFKRNNRPNPTLELNEKFFDPRNSLARIEQHFKYILAADDKEMALKMVDLAEKNQAKHHIRDNLYLELARPESKASATRQELEQSRPLDMLGASIRARNLEMTKRLVESNPSLVGPHSLESLIRDALLAKNDGAIKILLDRNDATLNPLKRLELMQIAFTGEQFSALSRMLAHYPDSFDLSRILHYSIIDRNSMLVRQILEKNPASISAIRNLLKPSDFQFLNKISDL